jgi:hypothetical protein
MSRGIMNSQRSKTRRRKVALTARESNLKSYNHILSTGKNIDGTEMNPQQRESWQAAIDRTAAEAATLKSRIGVQHGTL